MTYVIAIVAAMSAQLAVIAQHAAAQEALPLRQAVRDGIVKLGWPGIAGIEAARDLRYVGGQRFVLRTVADVEQHVFVEPGSAGRVARILWIQIEQFLPTAPGSYDYSGDSLVLEGDRAFRLNVRRYSTPPDSTSDRGALDRLLRRAGYRFPAAAQRVRWVSVAPDRRSEVIIIVVESEASGNAGEDVDVGAAVSRARLLFTLLPLSGGS